MAVAVAVVLVVAAVAAVVAVATVAELAAAEGVAAVAAGLAADLLVDLFLEVSLSGRTAGRLPSGTPCTAGADGDAMECAHVVLAATCGFIGWVELCGTRHCVWPCCTSRPLAFFFLRTCESIG